MDVSFWKPEWKAGALLIGGFFITYYLPVEAFTGQIALPAPLVESL